MFVALKEIAKKEKLWFLWFTWQHGPSPERYCDAFLVEDTKAESGERQCRVFSFNTGFTDDYPGRFFGKFCNSTSIPQNSVEVWFENNCNNEVACCHQLHHSLVQWTLRGFRGNRTKPDGLFSLFLVISTSITDLRYGLSRIN